MFVHRARQGVLLLVVGVLIVAAVGAVAVLGVRAIGGTTSDLYLHPFQVSNAALEARYQITAMHRSMRELLLASNATERKAALADLDGRGEAAESSLKVVERFYLGDAAEIHAAQAGLQRWETLRRRVAELALAGRRDEARALMTGDAGDAFDALDANISHILTYARTKAAIFASQATHHEDRVIPIIAGLSALLGILLATVFRLWQRSLYGEQQVSQALAVSQERFRTAQDLSLDGFAIFQAVRDQSGRVTDFAWDYANAASLKLCHATVESIAGRTLGELLPESMGPALFLRLRAVVELGIPDVYETYYDGDGISGWFRHMMVRLGDGVAVSFANITDIKRAQLTKSHFLASVSHDLRQPLQALRLFIDVLDGQVEGPARRAVTGAVQALGAAEQLLIALLDVSRLDAGLVEPRRREVELAPLLYQLAEECMIQADKHGDITVRFQPCSAVVWSDPVLLGRILRNLLHNALRYTGKGRILLGTRRAGDSVRIEVWDSGPGIPADEIGAIFEDFYQLGNAERDRSQGLGLGLAIVRRTAELLGHRFGVRSTPGHGSVFWVTVPRAPNTPVVAADALAAHNA